MASIREERKVVILVACLKRKEKFLHMIKDSKNNEDGEKYITTAEYKNPRLTLTWLRIANDPSWLPRKVSY